ncbi:DNA-3-methyladenine glycosylase [Parasphaerochaeta coccoides]|uniref:Putative 3-methyladenine DNA glycosylase n=1 Tax=Parasphaerochaeta coccoides (strain ATCC BAA-1237 / DSM 17374 / SPN1) TaxID=760011 RepID=F4GHP9_PARC1|nr:DNA-3-methyladenine glycosylase [Parasphaerochaeta coccoides]AEC01587.1 3-methyladenine DNA glycosylase [Parasphaerochaeta coccoides DSM 17374]
MRLPREFYDRDALSVARELLGKVLVHEIDGQKLAMRIVETEAYVGKEDKAAHFHGGRRTSRLEVIYGAPGFSYVFLVYGMHHCFNVVTSGKDDPQAVLVRAGQPVLGLEAMAQRRYTKTFGELTGKQIIGLTNGPGKLCQALDIDRSLNGADLCGEGLYLEEGEGVDFRIITTKRVGIDYAEEAKDFPLRFYSEGNAYVSVK